MTGQTLDRGNGTDGVTDVYKIELDEETSEYILKYCVKVGEEESIWNVTEKNNSSNLKTSTIEDTYGYTGENVTIQYEEGMTWKEFLSSKYNDGILNLGTYGDIVYKDTYIYVVDTNKGWDILEEIIDENSTYIFLLDL